MKTTIKSLAIAAFAAFAAFTAPAQAQNLPSNEAPEVILAGGSLMDEDGLRPRHHRRHGHQNGFSLEFYFGEPQVYYYPHHPRPVFHPRPVIRLTKSHVHWCYSRYRTYDHRSNTFVLRHGQRAYCVSPYSH